MTVIRFFVMIFSLADVVIFFLACAPLDAGGKMLFDIWTSILESALVDCSLKCPSPGYPRT
jgi:hypothetical protein